MKLSESQKALMELLVAGKAPKQIADTLGMAEGTVRTQLWRAKVKLDAKTTYQAIAIFTRQKVKEEI